MRKNIITLLMTFLLVAVLAACGGNDSGGDNITFNHSMNDNGKTEEKNNADDGTESARQTEPYKSQYLITSINSAAETMHVYRFSDGVEYKYHYGMLTEFYNKYGDFTSVSNFSVGDVISLLGTDSDGKVKRVEKSNDVWIYNDVQKFSFEGDGKVLKIGDTNYKISETTYFLSGNDKITMEDISADDRLTVVGVEKNILAVSVTTGHGFLKLKNTELFDNSFIQLNTDIFAKIFPDMEIEVPEGDYTLTVANNGWGGSREITIVRGETLTVDLDELKGEGPKKGKILFQIDVPATIYVDNQEIDYSEPVELTYGMHSLKVQAEGYDSWDKTLVVNSAEATIIIGMESTSSGSNSNNDKNSETDKDDKTDSENSETETSSEKTDSSDDITEELLEDYLSTISSLLDSIN